MRSENDSLCGRDRGLTGRKAQGPVGKNRWKAVLHSPSPLNGGSVSSVPTSPWVPYIQPCVSMPAYFLTGELMPSAPINSLARIADPSLSCNTGQPPASLVVEMLSTLVWLRSETEDLSWRDCIKARWRFAFSTMCDIGSGRSPNAAGLERNSGMSGAEMSSLASVRPSHICAPPVEHSSSL